MNVTVNGTTYSVRTEIDAWRLARSLRTLDTLRKVA